MKAKTVRGFLVMLNEIGEDTLIGDLKGCDKLTEDQQRYLRGIIAAVQNELGDMDHEIYEKFNVTPYKSSNS